MIKRYNFVIFTVIFTLSFAAVFCAGYYRKDMSAESGKFIIELPVNKTCCGLPPVEYDIQNEVTSKNSLQPGKISISTGRRSEIVNKGNEPLWLSVTFKGIDGTAKVVSSNKSFDEQTDCFTEPLMPGQTLDVSVNLDIPQDKMNSYLITAGTIEFVDFKSGKMLGEIPLKVVNSMQKNNCNSTCNSCDSCDCE